MDFFEDQDVARKKTGTLVFYFVIAILLMILVLYAVIIVVLESYRTAYGDAPWLNWWKPQLFFLVAGATLLIIAIGSYYKILMLREGGEAVATMLGGRRINSNTTDPKERQLLNIVQEMALASGINAPPVFVLDDENSINAFAAGHTPADAVIGVNCGTMRFLSRDELQGIIAHEFSHILNGDMQLNLKLIGLLNGILLFATIGYYILRVGSSGRSRNSKEKGNGTEWLLIIGATAFVIGYIGLFFGKLIKAAVSRQREFLADASAVQFTRNPDGIGGALKKIGGLTTDSRMESPEAETASHLFFANGLRSNWFNSLSTHPPLVERIRRIEPTFDGKYVATKPHKTRRKPLNTAEDGSPHTMVDALKQPLDPLSLGGKLALDPVLLLAAIGSPTTDDMNFAQRFLANMPEIIQEAVREPFSARGVILAMLLDDDQQIQDQQLAIICEQLGEATQEETSKLAPLINQQGAAARLPLIEIVRNTLQEMSLGQYEQFRQCLIAVIDADKKLLFFEFTLQRSLIRQLDQHFGLAEPPKVIYPATNAVQPQICDLISTLAYLGHADASLAELAFAKAAKVISTREPLKLRDREKCTVKSTGAALDKLAQSSPGVKKKIIHAATIAVASDKHVTVKEAELLRTIADSLDCPLPPIFASSLKKPAG